MSDEFERERRNLPSTPTNFQGGATVVKKLKPYAKAIVAAFLLLAFWVGSLFGIETGIDPEAQVQAIVLVILATLGVYTVPNEPEDD